MAKAKYEAEEPRTPSLLDAPLVIGPEIDKAVPELDAVLGEIATAAGRFIKHAMGQYPGDGPGGIPVVLSQALNDYLDVLFDINAGRGRSALRGARALFELLVTGMDIMTDKTLEQRYMDHESVISQLEAAMEFEADRLPKRPRKEDARRRQRLAKSSQADFASAIEKYGKAFKRRWAPHNLATRARKYGLEKDYDFYRLSSAVLHGSSGGALGIRKVIQDETVHRTGMALLLCPLAFLQALRYFDMLVEAYAKQYSATFTTDLRSAIAEALKLWPKYRRAIHRLDLSLWPKSPPPNLLPYLVATSSPREQKWFIHDPDAGLMIEANPPQYIPEFQEESINATLDEYYKAQPGELEPLSMVVVGVDISPKHGAEWEDDKTVLTRETGYPFK